MSGFHMDHDSMRMNSNQLLDLSGLLEEGKLDGNLTTLTRAPRAPAPIGDQVEKFALFANDQYQDLIALLGSLATKLKAASDEHITVDAQVANELNQLLSDSVYLPPKNH